MIFKLDEDFKRLGVSARPGLGDPSGYEGFEFRVCWPRLETTCRVMLRSSVFLLSLTIHVVPINLTTTSIY